MSDIIISLRVKGIPSACRGCGVGEGGGSGPGEGQWRGPKAMAVGHGTAGRGSEARQAAITSGPDDCHVTMQAAMAVVLAKWWPYVVLRWP